MTLNPVASPVSRSSLGLRILKAGLPLVLVGLAVGIWQRERLWVWYCAERLVRASEEDRSTWGDRLAAQGEPAIPRLLDLLCHDEAGVCRSSRDALTRMVADWPRADGRRAGLARAFLEQEPRFSTPGRLAGLDLLPVLEPARDAELRSMAKRMIGTAVQSESMELRIQAAKAALRPEVDCLEEIVPLLQDQESEVRRAAVLSLGPVREGELAAVSDDGLLRCLHDSDPEVRRFAEMGLKSRGRSARDIRLGRRYAAPNPAERQKLLIDLADEEELDVAVWLQRLAKDPDPAVRAGVARLAAERQTDLGGRLEEMGRSDPDETVRRIADYYHRRLQAAR